ncbi:MAG: hypothetical protein EZS28_042238, partial [Streblomastix strix]
CVAASTALIQLDFPATQRFILTYHHVARVIVGDSYLSRDVKLAADEFKPLIGKKGLALNALSNQSKDQIKGLNSSIKLIVSKSPIPQVQLTQPQALQSDAIIITIIFQSKWGVIINYHSQISMTDAWEGKRGALQSADGKRFKL